MLNGEYIDSICFVIGFLELKPAFLVKPNSVRILITNNQFNFKEISSFCYFFGFINQLSS